MKTLTIEEYLGINPNATLQEYKDYTDKILERKLEEKRIEKKNKADYFKSLVGKYIKFREISMGNEDKITYAYINDRIDCTLKYFDGVRILCTPSSSYCEAGSYNFWDDNVYKNRDRVSEITREQYEEVLDHVKASIGTFNLFLTQELKN